MTWNTPAHEKLNILLRRQWSTSLRGRLSTPARMTWNTPAHEKLNILLRRQWSTSLRGRLSVAYHRVECRHVHGLQSTPVHQQCYTPLPPLVCSVHLSRCCTPSHTKCCTGSRRSSPSRTLCGSSSSPAWTHTQHPRWQAVAIEPDKHRNQAQYNWNSSSCPVVRVG